MSLRNLLLSQTRNTKKIMLMGHDFLVIFIVFWLALGIRNGFSSHLNIQENWLIIVIAACISVGIFYALKLYHAVMRYAGLGMINALVYGAFASTLVLATLNMLIQGHLHWTLPLLYFFMLVVFLAGSRVIIREWLSGVAKNRCAPVIVYGAGQSGRQLVEAIKQLHEYQPIAFVDDDKNLHNTIIYDLKVYKPEDIGKLKKEFAVEKILLAIPSLTKDEKRQVVSFLEQFELEVLSIPGMKDLVDGKLEINNLKKVSVLDLLGRTPIEPKPELMKANISGKHVLVTGAGGSIGSELCRQIVKVQPKSIILFEVSEFALYSIHKELTDLKLDVVIHPILGSVQNEAKLKEVMKAFHVQTVYHAAAYKHVPMVEYNMFAGIANNAIGTHCCAKAAIASGVERFVLISTDKAVRPTNTMGATKRFSELALQALAQEKNHNTVFCMVRFGNVLGSSGSVVPVFEKQIENGGPITLTHQDITRYFMTIPEAAQLVIQAGAMGSGGNVYVLDMGEPIKIYDLAKQMVHLSGLKLKDKETPDGDIEIAITGLRPGEKLYEELLIGDNVEETSHPRIMTANEVSLTPEKFDAYLKQITAAISASDFETARKVLLEAPTGFNPKDDICDLVYLSHKK